MQWSKWSPLIGISLPIITVNRRRYAGQELGYLPGLQIAGEDPHHRMRCDFRSRSAHGIALDREIRSFFRRCFCSKANWPWVTGIETECFRIAILEASKL